MLQCFVEFWQTISLYCRVTRSENTSIEKSWVNRAVALLHKDDCTLQDYLNWKFDLIEINQYFNFLIIFALCFDINFPIINRSRRSQGTHNNSNVAMSISRCYIMDNTVITLLGRENLTYRCFSTFSAYLCVTTLINLDPTILYK